MKCNKLNCLFNENGECEQVDQEDYENASPNDDNCQVYIDLEGNVK